MAAFGQGLQTMAGWEDAVEAHWRLVDIHPFADGNGRTARLLMNTMLLREGYPPVSIGPDRKPAYVAEPIGRSLIGATGRDRCCTFMGERLAESLEDHLRFLQPDKAGVGGSPS